MPWDGEAESIRLMLRDTYLDYAAQAVSRGALFEADIWNRAAEIASGSVARKVEPVKMKSPSNNE